MLIITFIIMMVVFCGGILDRAVAIACRFIERRRRLASLAPFFKRTWANTPHLLLAQDYDIELRRIDALIRRWDEEHPFGPLSPQEVTERDELEYQMVGTLLARSAELEQKFPNHILNGIDNAQD